MNLIEYIGTLRREDIYLVIAFFAFCVYIVAALWVVNHDSLRIKITDKLMAWTEKVEAFNAKYSYNDQYDSEWMDYDKWRASRDKIR